jgi:3-hydroxybutyryl-CoA dehydrogenase
METQSFMEAMPAIETVAVIGAGAIGQGVAQLAALGGYRTILEDIVPASLRRAGNQIQTDLEAAVSAGRLTPVQAEAALGRLEYAGNLDQAARQADLVIEAVPEEMDSKIEIFTLLDRTCRTNTILVSNTSLDLAELASVTYRASRIVGMRFLHPVSRMRSVEVVPTAQTDQATLAAACRLGRRMGMEVLVLPELSRKL